MADRRPASEKPRGADKPNRIKRLLAAKIARDYGPRSGLVLLVNRGLDSEQTGELRSGLRAQGLRLHVIRNRITLRAFREMGLQDAEKLFSGPTAVVDSEDPVTAAKLALEFCRKFKDKLAVAGGVVEGKVLGPEEVETLSQSKSKPELLAEVAGLVRGPGAGLAAAIAAPGGRVAGAVKALAEKLEKAAPAAEPAAAAPAAEPVAAAPVPA